MRMRVRLLRGGAGEAKAKVVVDFVAAPLVKDGFIFRALWD